MNLKESFRYQNFLEAVIGAAGSSLTSSEHCLKTTRNHLRKAANPDVDDVVEEVKVDEFFANDDILKFVEFIIEEKSKLSEAISKAKSSLPFDVDAAIATNKFRQRVCSTIRNMLRYSTPSKRVENGRDYKFNLEGNQVGYVYNIEVTKEVTYDVDSAKRMLKQLIVKSDEVSSAIDNAMVTTEVDYQPPFDVNDSFEDVMTEFLKKTA